MMDVKKVKEKNEQLREMVAIGAKWMEWWLNEDMCDCEGIYHTCGRDERKKELERMKQVLEDD